MEIPKDKKVYFSSDNHLGLPSLHKSHDREKIFVKWLDTIKHDAEIIFLLGDLFDFWFAIWRMMYVVIGTTFLTYLFNIYALKTLSPTTVGSFIYLQPIITIIFALITGNDTLDTTKILSCILVFVGVYLVSLKNKNG